MNDSRSNTFLRIFFFGVIFLIVIGAILYITIWSEDRDFITRTMPKYIERPRLRDITKENKAYIFINKPVVLGAAIITYRGIVEGFIHMDVLIPELDRDYAYLKKIPLNSDERGIPIADKVIHPTSAGRSGMGFNVSDS